MKLRLTARFEWALSLALTCVLGAPVSDAYGKNSPASESGYIVTFREPGLLAYRGDIEGLSPAMHEVAGNLTLDSKSPEAVAYGRYLEARRSSYLASIASALGRSVVPTHHYAVTQNGIALDLSAAEADSLRLLSGVETVVPSIVERTATYRGPEYIGAGSAWDGSVFTGAVATRGERVTIGIFDTGIDAAHPSFANEASCGYDAQNRKLKSAVDCSSTDAAGVCNGADPADGDGHGTHVASIAAGNRLTASVVPAPEFPTNFDHMTGVAPCAALRSYKVCSAPDRCTGAATLAAVQQAIADRVDVVNYSITGGRSARDPRDVDQMLFALVQANIAVVAAAGDQRGPSSRGNIEHRAPWVASIAASSHDSVQVSRIRITGPGEVPSALSAFRIVPGHYSSRGSDLPESMTARRLDASPTLCDAGAIPANFFAGGVAYVSAGGTCTVADKINHAKAAGAVMVLLGTPQQGHLWLNTRGADKTVPTFTLAATTQAQLDPFLDANGGVATLDFTAYFASEAYPGYYPDIVADSNLVGPSSASDEWGGFVKPDFIAPGIDVYAAMPAGYGYMSGTSMAAPHVAGAVALLRALRPGWTAMELLSAMKLTAYADVINANVTNYASINEKGSGRVDIRSAVNSPLLLDESASNFVNAETPQEWLDLNLPSIRSADCTGGCSFRRSVKNSGSTPMRWFATYTHSGGPEAGRVTISPSDFTIAGGGTQELEIKVLPVYYSEGGHDYVVEGKISLVPYSRDLATLSLAVSVSGKTDGIFTEQFGAESAVGFSSLESLLSRGWATVNHSSPASAKQKPWMQGSIYHYSPPLLAAAAQAGHPNSYVMAAANDSVLPDQANVVLSVWLFSPEIEFNTESTVKFYTKSLFDIDSEGGRDSLEVRVCRSADCGKYGTDQAALTNYPDRVLAINQELAQATYPAQWTPFVVAAKDGLPTSGRGRIAFRYYTRMLEGPFSGFVHAGGIALDSVELGGR